MAVHLPHRRWCTTAGAPSDTPAALEEILVSRRSNGVARLGTERRMANAAHVYHPRKP